MNPQNTKIQNAIFWIEVDKIVPNPYQPRREFDQDRLKELSDSIRQYGVLQPLVVSRKEEVLENGSISVKYELIAGERRLRASRLAGLLQVPVVVRIGDDNREMLELAIIENLQREDLNAVERAQSFQRLADEFKLTWTDVGKKVGKSREYVSNTVRILMLPQDILDALSKGFITEGHTRPLLMLIDRPEEQMTLFKEMLIRKMTVREAEGIARKIAFEKIRKKSLFMTPEVVDTEEKLAEALGTRVQIEPREKGGKILIEYFSHDEFLALSQLLKQAGTGKSHQGMFDKIREEDIEILKAAATEYIPKKERESFPVKETVQQNEPSLVSSVMMRAEDVVTQDSQVDSIQNTSSETIAPPIVTIPLVSEPVSVILENNILVENEKEILAKMSTLSEVSLTDTELQQVITAQSDTVLPSTETISFVPSVTVKQNADLLKPLSEEIAFSKSPEIIAQIAFNETLPNTELDDRSIQEVKEDEQEEDLYNIKNFSL